MTRESPDLSGVVDDHNRLLPKAAKVQALLSAAVVSLRYRGWRMRRRADTDRAEASLPIEGVDDRSGRPDGFALGTKGAQFVGLDRISQASPVSDRAM